jgi:HrpA-like RNA helicase
LRRWEGLYLYCRDGSRDSLFPLPPLAQEQVFRTVRDMEGVEVVNCSGEADAVMASMCSMDPSFRTFVLGQDSDFYLMKGIRYIPFDSLVLDSPGCFSARVFERSRVAAELLLSEEKLVEAALLLGNDYTSHLHLQDRENATRGVGPLLNWIREQPDNYQVGSPDLSDDGCLNFARALYDLDVNALNQFPDDPECSIHSGAPEVKLEPFGRPLALLHDEESAAMAALECYTLSSNPIDPAQLEALQQVIQGYRSPYPKEAHPDWSDVEVAYRFQVLLGKLLREREAPAAYFDGPSFHYLARLLREAEDFTPRAGAPGPNVWYEDLMHPRGYDEGLDLDSDVQAQDAWEVEEEVAEEECDVGLPRLPIDDHRDEILENIFNNRVCIIHGETGCGKSSKVPLILLEDARERGESVKMFVSQPRRIAARALMQRVRQVPGCESLVGMRLGHGMRDETPSTRIWFVTTGYLVRLLAHHPETLRDHTHLVIDEVHERSVDTDILCLLAKRLLDTHPTIRLVLMSATLATEVYRSYFQIERPAIFVGARRFPIRVLFADDIANSQLGLPMRSRELARKIVLNTETGAEPGIQLTKQQYDLAVMVTRAVGDVGSAVLIFVSGMNDIVELIERFDGIKGDTEYKTLPIHGDIPFDEQMAAFEPAGPGQVKVVIATNAAESSLTLSDVDNVICLGTSKQIQYNECTHRTQLAPAWISQANATQRSGRTGRVRPGTVYRMYARELYETYMPPHEEGEIHRQPLDSVIIGLKAMLGQAVVPVLENVLEPPLMDHIDRAFQSLWDNGFISTPDDEGLMTNMGNFVAGLGVDLQLGRMIGLSAQFGCLPEGICMAAALSVPKPPFRITSPLIHNDPDEYNSIVADVMLAQMHFDAGHYSEPIMLTELMAQYENVPEKKKHEFGLRWSLAHSRIKQLHSTARHLRERVGGLLGCTVPAPKAPSEMSPAKINTLRLLLLWSLRDNLLLAKVTRPPSKEPFQVTLTGPSVKADMLRQALPQRFVPPTIPMLFCDVSLTFALCTPLPQRGDDL